MSNLRITCANCGTYQVGFEERCSHCGSIFTEESRDAARAAARAAFKQEEVEENVGYWCFVAFFAGIVALIGWANDSDALIYVIPPILFVAGYFPFWRLGAREGNRFLTHAFLLGTCSGFVGRWANSQIAVTEPVGTPWIGYLTFSLLMVPFVVWRLKPKRN
ncbi:MAG: hypothetical protein WKF37_07670 [Bryobacteraceae bacterium]